MAAARGRTILMDHLPDLRCRQSTHGGLLIIFSNGECYYYPLNQDTKGTNKASTGRILTSEPTSRKAVRDGKISGAGGGNPKYNLFDVPLHLNDSSYRVHTFPFMRGADRKSFRPPKKALLSPNKRLLLLFGASFRGQSSVLIYQIVEETPEFFRLIYHDLTVAFCDMCFSPDSSSIVALPAQQTGCLLILLLATDYSPPPTESDIEDGEARQHQHILQASFQPRQSGPLTVLGPAKGVFDQDLVMTRIASSTTVSPSLQFSYITWNDEGMGEYCLWLVYRSPGERAPRFKFYPNLLRPRLFTHPVLEEDDTPKLHILNMIFSPHAPDEKILICVRQDNFEKALSAGLGLEMASVALTHVEEMAEKESTEATWYKIAETATPGGQQPTLACLHWTDSLLLGKAHTGAAVVRGGGLFELADFHYGSAFQALYDKFTKTVSNFCQVGKYHRFWTAENTGALHVILVTPEVPCGYPEWRDLFTSDRILSLRVLGRRIGYFINDIRGQDVDTSSKRAKKKGDAGEGTKELSVRGSGQSEQVFGLHLYTCFYCKRVLLKPLQCGRCMRVVYCSRECQRNHWPDHQCSPPPDEAAAIG